MDCTSIYGLPYLEMIWFGYGIGSSAENLRLTPSSTWHLVALDDPLHVCYSRCISSWMTPETLGEIMVQRHCVKSTASWHLYETSAVYSHDFPVGAGVPQGSVLGPFLWGVLKTSQTSSQTQRNLLTGALSNSAVTTKKGQKSSIFPLKLWRDFRLFKFSWRLSYF